MGDRRLRGARAVRRADHRYAAGADADDELFVEGADWETVVDAVEDDTITVNMGPQHPSTHGVLRLVLELDGETVVACKPVIGYLHTGIEKNLEYRPWVQGVTNVTRMDYLAPLFNELGYCMAVEKLFGIDPPMRAKFIRTIVGEMSRIANHLLWLATHALDIGAMTVFLYCFREREWILDLFEMICGARLTVTYPRVGGVRNDVPQAFLDSLWKFTEEFPSRILEYETLIDQNRIWLQRTVGIGVISAEEAVNWGMTGPTLRGSGVPYDVRKHMPYDAYDQVEFDVPIGTAGDTYDRYRCRMLEMRQSNSMPSYARSGVVGLGWPVMFSADSGTKPSMSLPMSTTTPFSIRRTTRPRSSVPTG